MVNEKNNNNKQSSLIWQYSHAMIFTYIPALEQRQKVSDPASGVSIRFPSWDASRARKTPVQNLNRVGFSF
jgi:hypothetical protein